MVVLLLMLLLLLYINHCNHIYIYICSSSFSIQLSPRMYSAHSAFVHNGALPHALDITWMLLQLAPAHALLHATNHRCSDAKEAAAVTANCFACDEDVMSWLCAAAAAGSPLLRSPETASRSRLRSSALYVCIFVVLERVDLRRSPRRSASSKPRLSPAIHTFIALRQPSRAQVYK